jgi:two-component system response regulator YesN
MTNAVGANVRLNKYYTQLRELVKDYFDCITGPVMGNRIVLFVPFEREKTRYEERVEIITRTRNMIYRLEAGIDMQFRGGIGMVTPVEEAMDSYKGALRALRESDSHVVHITDIPAIANYDGEYPLKLENQYFQRGAKADKEGAAACANEFFDWMLEHDGNVRANIEVKVLELIIRLEMMAFEEGSVRYGFRYRENYLEEIQGAADMAALRCWFVRKTREVCDNISTSRERESENVVFRVKSYINDNYAQDISLDDVSRLVDISPYYFSKLFKQEVGENFIEYLTRTRITHAMRLLEDSRYSIKEVCLMCGYSDPNYFSRIFKKYEGMTPSEYRER